MNVSASYILHAGDIVVFLLFILLSKQRDGVLTLTTEPCFCQGEMAKWRERQMWHAT